MYRNLNLRQEHMESHERNLEIEDQQRANARRPKIKGVMTRMHIFLDFNQIQQIINFIFSIPHFHLLFIAEYYTVVLN